MGIQLGKLLHSPTNEKLMQKIFKHYDTNNNNSLDRKEFSQLGYDFYEYSDGETGILKHLPSMIKMKVNEKEPNEVIDFLFQQINTNKSGSISYEEFKKWCFDQYDIEERLLIGADLDFEFELNKDNKSNFSLEKHNKKLRKRNDGLPNTVTSKNLFSGTGKYIFEFEVQTKKPAAFSIGVVSEDFCQWNDLCCQSRKCKGVTGTGFQGDTVSTKSDLRFSDGDILEVKLNLLDKEFSVLNKSDPSIVYIDNISELIREFSYVRLAVSIGYEDESISLLKSSRSI